MALLKMMLFKSCEIFAKTAGRLAQKTGSLVTLQ
jgi:hypothetical protein